MCVCVCECMRVEEGSVKSKKINVMLCYDSV